MEICFVGISHEVSPDISDDVWPETKLLAALRVSVQASWTIIDALLAAISVEYAN